MHPNSPTSNIDRNPSEDPTDNSDTRPENKEDTDDYVTKYYIQDSGLCKNMSTDCLTTTDHLLSQFTESEEIRRIEALFPTYSHYIQIPRDGNCFYRAFLFGFINCRTEEDILKIIKEKSREFEQVLVDNGYEDSTIIDFFDNGIEFIDQLLDKSVSDSEIFTRLLDRNFSNYYTIYLKLIIAAYLLKSKDFYGPFIIGSFPDIQTFCHREIEPFGRHAGELEISVLGKALDLNITIYSIPLESKQIQRYPDGFIQSHINIIHTPGHYELLLTKPIDL